MSLKRRDHVTAKLQRRGAPQPRACDEQEERVADAIGGKRVRGSGCSRRPDRKGDAISRLFRSECKTTTARGIRVEREHLVKIRSEALATGKHPAYVFGFNGDDWFAVPLSLAKKLARLVEAVEQDDHEEAKRLAEMIQS